MERYKYTDKELRDLLSSMTIIIDTREKSNNHIIEWFDNKDIKHIKQSLPHGDYSFLLPKNEQLGINRDMYFYNDITIEKKNSIDELAQNFSADRDRISDELLRHKGDMIIMIEESNYGDILNQNYKSKYSVQSFVGTLHSFSLRYNTPFIFIPKDNAAQFIYFTFFYWLRNKLLNK